MKATRSKLNGVFWGVFCWHDTGVTLEEETQLRKHLHQIVGKTAMGTLFGLTLDVERPSLCGLYHTWTGMLGDRRQRVILVSGEQARKQHSPVISASVFAFRLRFELLPWFPWRMPCDVEVLDLVNHFISRVASFHDIYYGNSRQIRTPSRNGKGGSNARNGR